MCEDRRPAAAVQDAGRPRLMPGLREDDLARLWEGGTIPAAALVTLEGVPLRVVYRGRPNGGAGPDFRDAVIALPDGRLLHGDVELHLRASDFHRHGHDRDHAYDRVVLHLVYRADAGAATVLRSGRQAPVVALDRWLSARAAELQALLEQPALWREPCQSAVERMGHDEVERILARLGERRLRMLAAAVKRPPPVALYERLVRTLGHGPQRPAWIELARRVPPSALAAAAALEPSCPARGVEALLLGAAGLLDDVQEAAGPEEAEPYRAESRRLWRALGAPRSQPITAAGPRRPANHPARRLAGLARLLAGGPEALLLGIGRALLADVQPEREIIRLLCVPAEGVWEERTVPWAAPGRRPAPSLIGPDKALELALNAALPALLSVAEREGRRELAAAALRTFHALPSPPAYGRTAHLFRALRAGESGLLRRAAQSQAALHLTTYYCTRGGCGRCPLS